MGIADDPAKSPFSSLANFELRDAVDQDIRNIREFRLKEQEDQLRRLGTHTPQQRAAIGEAVGLMDPRDLLRKWSDSYRMLEAAPAYDPRSFEQLLAEERSDRFAEDHPVQGFIVDAIAGAARNVQDVGLSMFAIGSTLGRGAADFLPSSMSSKLVGAADWIDEGRDAYRDLVMTGVESPLGSDSPTFIQGLNYRGNKDTWGTWTGNVAFYALPSASLAVGGLAAAKALNAAVMLMMGSQAAGQGIDRYRAEEMAEGRSPNPWRAMAVGIGYAAAEILTERMSEKIPLGRISTHGASKVAEKLVQGNARAAAQYLLAASGHASIEGLEEVVTGELQGMIDAGLVTGSFDRDWAMRFREFGAGAAGGGMATLAGSLSPTFRGNLMNPDSRLSGAELDRRLMVDFDTLAKSPAGSRSALVRVITAAGKGADAEILATLKEQAATLAEKAGRPEVAETIATALDAPRPATAKDDATLVAEFVEDIKAATGEDVAISVLQESGPDLSRYGVRAIMVESDKPLPFPAYATSDPGVIVLTRGGEDFAVVAHELVHQFKRSHPGTYAAMIQQTAGPVLAHAAQYADELRAAGVNGEMPAESIVDEGAARMVERIAGAAGLKSRLDPDSANVLGKMGDWFRRRASKLGLNGPVAKAVVKAFEAVELGTTQFLPPAGGTVNDPSSTTPDPLRRTRRERFGMFAVRRSNDDQLILPFDTKLARAIEALNDPQNPIQTSGVPQNDEAVRPKPVARPHLAATMKIAEAARIMQEAFVASKVATSNLKLELAAAMSTALPGKAGQKFANRILDADGEAQLRAIVSAAHAAYVNATTGRSAKDAIREAERAATLIRDETGTTEREKLRSILKEYRAAEPTRREEFRVALREQRRLAKAEAAALVRERTTGLRASFAEERAKARATLAAARRDAREKADRKSKAAARRLADLERASVERAAKIREHFRNQRDILAEKQQIFSDAVKSTLPTQIQGPIMTSLSRARTDLQMVRLADRAMRSLETFNRRKARRKAQAEVVKLSQRKLDPQATREFFDAARQWGVLSENVVAKSQSSLRRKVGKLFKKSMMTYGTAFDYENVSVQVAQIGERWRNRRDGFVDAKAEQVSRSAHQLAAELEKQTRKVKTDHYGRKTRGFAPLSSVFAFLTLGQMDQDSAAQFAFGKDSHGDQILYRDLRAGYAAKLKATQADHDFILDTLGRLNVSVADLGTMSEFISNSIGRQPERVMKRVPVTLHKVACPDAGTLEMTSAERICLAGHYNAHYNRSEIDNGAPIYVERTSTAGPITMADLAAIDASMPQEERAIYAMAKKLFNGVFKERMRGRAIEKTGSDNTVEDYWPCQREIGGIDDPAAKMHLTPKTFSSLGMSQERVGSLKPIIVRDVFMMLIEHSWISAGIAHQSGQIEFARSVVNSETFAETSKNFGRFDYRRHFDEFLDDMDREWNGAGQDRGAHYLDTILMKLRNQTVKGALGLNVRVAMLQPLGALTLTAYLPSGEVIRSLANGSAFRFSLDSEIRKSPFLRHRVESSPVNLATGASSGRPGVLGTRSEGTFLMFMAHAMDNALVRVAWDASARMAERALPNATPEAILAETIRLAEEAILRTQPTSDPLHKTATQRSARTSGALSLLTMFTAQVSKNLNIAARAMMEASENPSAATMSKASHAVAVAVIANSLGLSLANHLWSKLGSEEEGITARSLLTDLAANSAGMFHGGAYLGFIASSIGSEKPRGMGSPQFSAVASSMRDLATGLVAAARADGKRADEKRAAGLERAAVAFATLIGVPTSPYRTFKRIVEEDKRKKSKRGTSLREAASSR